LSERLLIAWRNHYADLAYACIQRFFGNDLDERFSESVAVDEWQHFLLHHGRRGVLARTSASSRYHCFSYFRYFGHQEALSVFEINKRTPARLPL
jgi:hypothetical protein